MTLSWLHKIFSLILLTSSLVVYGGNSDSLDRMNQNESNVNSNKEKSDTNIQFANPNDRLVTEIGSTIQLELLNRPEGGEVIFTSSDNEKIPVNENGLVNILGISIATITVTLLETEDYLSSSAQLDIYVLQPDPVQDPYYVEQDGNTKFTFDLFSELVGEKNENLERKSVNIELANYSSIFQISTTATFVNSTDNGYASYYLEVTNIGNRTYCFINLDNIRILDESNNILNAGELNYNYVFGANTHVFPPVNITTNTCLEPSETGFVVGSGQYGSISEIDKFRFDGFGRINSIGTDLESLDFDYLNYTPNSNSQGVSFINRSGVNLEKFGPSWVLFFDGNGDFNGFTSMNLKEPRVVNNNYIIMDYDFSIKYISRDSAKIVTTLGVKPINADLQKENIISKKNSLTEINISSTASFDKISESFKKYKIYIDSKN